MKTKNIMIVGVGGQGSLLASKLLGRLLLGRGLSLRHIWRCAHLRICCTRKCLRLLSI